MSVEEFDINSVDFEKLNLIENTPFGDRIMELNVDRINDTNYKFKTADLIVPEYMKERIREEECLYEKHN